MGPKSKIVAASLCILLVFAGCRDREVEYGSGKVVTEEREVSDFKEIALSGSGTVEIVQGIKPRLFVQTDDNLLNYFETLVSDGVLHLGPKEGAGIPKIVPSKETFYRVTIRDLDKLTVSGNGVVNTIEELIGDHLAITVNGAARLTMDIEFEQLDLSISGAAKATLKGSAKSQIIQIQGAGIYDGSALLTQIAEVTLSGAGLVAVNVVETLDVKLNGTGTVTYKGSPKVTSTVTGIGEVKKIKW